MRVQHLSKIVVNFDFTLPHNNIIGKVFVLHLTTITLTYLFIHVLLYNLKHEPYDKPKIQHPRRNMLTPFLIEHYTLKAFMTQWNGFVMCKFMYSYCCMWWRRLAYNKQTTWWRLHKVHYVFSTIINAKCQRDKSFLFSWNFYC